MRPTAFDYVRATSLSQALEALSSGDDVKAIAGGHSLIPALNLRLAHPRRLVDIGRLNELRGIRVDNGSLRVGAGSTHAEVASSEDVQRHCLPLAQAAGRVGDPQVRNWGTLGGNIAHADPASDPPTVLVACGAGIHVQGENGTRVIEAEDFFQGLFETALESAELIVGVEIPGLGDRKGAYLKLAHPASRYALVGVCVVLEMDGDQCRDARVAIGGALPKATRMRSAEEVLRGSDLGDDALERASAALESALGDDVIGDIQAPADYRRAMAGVYLRRAVREALKG